MEGLRKFTKSRLGQFSMLLIVSPMAFLGMSGGTSSGNADEIVKIGNQGIGLKEFQSAVNNQKATLLKKGVDASLIKEDVLQKQVLEMLIQQNLLRQQASKLGLSPSDATITAMLKQDPELKDKEGNFSNERFAMVLNNNNMTKDQLFAKQKEQISVQQLTNGIMGTAIYPMTAIDKLIHLQLDSRNIWLYRIAWQDFKDNVTVTDRDIEEYYNQHKDTLNSIPMVDLSYIQLSADILEVEELTQEDLQLQYEAYKQKNNLTDMRNFSHILLTGDDAEAKAKEVKLKLDNEGDFVVLAKEYSADSSKDSGGDIGRFDAAMFGEDGATVAKAVDGLQVGDVSEPVQTAFGYHIFTVSKNDIDKVPTIESLQAELSEKAKAYKQQILFAELVTRINVAVVDGLSIQDIANQESLSIQTIADYQKTDNLTALALPSVITAAFDEFTIQDQSVSHAIEVKDSMLWVQPSKYRPSTTLSLEVVAPQITALLTQQKATQLALDKAKKLASSIKVKADIKDRTDTDSQAIKFTPLANLKRQNKILSKAENSIAFSRKAPDSGIVAMEVETDTGASVIIADAMQTTEDAQLSDLEKLQVATGVRNVFGEEQLSDYLHYLKTVTKVEIDQEKIDESNGAVN